MPPNNILPIHGNEKTMNLNTLILTNIQSSPYFKVHLYELKTYHQVIDEIYTRVGHLEPWEKGSRKTAGQTGMCGGVRGVGAGGIVSSAFCLLYKLYTLKLTRKQLIGVCTHTDSPYIRGIGFMYARFTQPPADLWEWFEPYLDDEEEVDVKAGGGHVMTMGELAAHFLTKLEWYSTLFPRIPVPIQKQIEQNLLARKAACSMAALDRQGAGDRGGGTRSFGDGQRTAYQEDRLAGRDSRVPAYDGSERGRGRPDDRYSRQDFVRRSPDRQQSPRSTDRNSHFTDRHSNSRMRSVERDKDQRGRDTNDHQSKPSGDRVRHRSRSADRHSRTVDRHRSSSRKRSVERSHRRSRSRDKHSRREHRREERDRERSHKTDHKKKRCSRSRERHRSTSRHDSKSRVEREKPSSKERSSQSRSTPKNDDPFERDLHKELERVKKSKLEQQNGE